MKYKNKIFSKKALATFMAAATISVGAASYSQKAEALSMPTINPAQLMATIQANIMRGMEALKEQELIMRSIEFAGDAAGMLIDNDNNLFANMIAREGKAKQDTQNIEQAERASPAMDACETLVAAVSLGDAVCSAMDYIAKKSRKATAIDAVATGGGRPDCTEDECTIIPDVPPTVDSINRMNNVNAKNIIDRCAELKGEDGHSLCADASLMVAAPGGALSTEEYEAVELQLEMIKGVEVEVPDANENLGEMNTPQYKRAMTRDFKRTLPVRQASVNQTIVNTLLNGTKAEPGKEAEKGEVQVLQEYLSERLGSENWLCEVSNTCKDKDREGAPYVAPAELKRRSIQMDAVMLHISLQQYKSSLRSEKLLADLVLLEGGSRD